MGWASPTPEKTSDVSEFALFLHTVISMCFPSVSHFSQQAATNEVLCIYLCNSPLGWTVYRLWTYFLLHDLTYFLSVGVWHIFRENPNVSAKGKCGLEPHFLENIIKMTLHVATGQKMGQSQITQMICVCNSFLQLLYVRAPTCYLQGRRFGTLWWQGVGGDG